MYHSLDVTFLEHIPYFSTSSLVSTFSIDDTLFDFLLPLELELEPFVTLTTESPIIHGSLVITESLVPPFL